MADQPSAMDRGAWGLLLLLSVLWGATFFFVEIAIRDLPPMTIVLARVALASLLLLPLFWYKGFTLPRALAGWWPFLIMGLLNNAIPFSLINAGQGHVTAGLASILNATTPLFAVMVMAAFREERLSWNRLAGVSLGILGVGILSGFDGAMGEGQILGIALCLTGALSYGFSALWGRRQLRGVPPIKSATCQLLCSSAIMSVLVVVVDRPWTLPPPSAATWASLAALALFSTALAYLVFFTILVRAGASNVMLVTLLIPVTAVLLGYLFLNEAVHLQHILGAATIGLGLLFIDGRLLVRLKQAPA